MENFTEFKKGLIEAIECGKDTDCGFDGEDEFEFEIFNPEHAANMVIEFLIKKKLIPETVLEIK